MVRVHHLVVHVLVRLWMHAHSCVHAGHLVFLLPLHAPVLEPYFDLALCEAEGVGDLYPSPPGEVAVEVELLLQLQGLVAGVGCALAFGLAIGVDGT